MNLVLLRHATRSSFSPESSHELPLSPVGLAQAEDLVQAVTANRLPPPTALVSSPKLRARQTLLPLSKACALELQIMNELDERRDSETQKAFEQRVRSAIDLIRNRVKTPNAIGETIYVCTHLDVLEAASHLWPTDFSDREAQGSWSTLEYQIFEWNDEGLQARSRGRIEPRGYGDGK